MTTDGSCKRCDSSLIRIKWNSVTDVVFCDNYKCELFHTPISNIYPKEYKAPEWLKGLEGLYNPKDNRGNSRLDFQTRLYNLKHYIYRSQEEGPSN